MVHGFWGMIKLNEGRRSSAALTGMKQDHTEKDMCQMPRRIVRYCLSQLSVLTTPLRLWLRFAQDDIRVVSFLSFREESMIMLNWYGHCILREQPERSVCRPSPRSRAACSGWNRRARGLFYT